MICVVLLVVYVILSFFSVKYRQLAKEAFQCVSRRVRLKPCETDLDLRVKNQITGKLMNSHPRMARFVYNHFEAISWVITIIMIASFIYFLIWIYNILFSCGCGM